MQLESIVARGRMLPDKGSPAQYRATRHKKESQRARANALLLLAADARTLYRGADHTVTTLAAGLGFEPHDLTIIRVSLRRRTITLIIAPKRLWHRREARDQLLLLKRLARNVGARAVLVPGAQLRKQPRLENAVAVAGSFEAELTLSQRSRVEILVLAKGGSATLSECAEVLLDHPDPVAAVLALVRARRLTVSLAEPITAATMVMTNAASQREGDGDENHALC